MAKIQLRWNNNKSLFYCDNCNVVLLCKIKLAKLKNDKNGGNARKMFGTFGSIIVFFDLCCHSKHKILNRPTYSRDEQSNLAETHTQL